MFIIRINVISFNVSKIRRKATDYQLQFFPCRIVKRQVYKETSMPIPYVRN